MHSTAFRLGIALACALAPGASKGAASPAGDAVWPFCFEANHGQGKPGIKFFARSRSYTLFLTDRGVIVGGPASLRIEFLGASPATRLLGMDEQAGKVNYFSGRNPARWHRDIATYARLKYERLYRGVDAVFYGNAGRLEFDLLVAPGADPRAIRLGFRGARRVELDAQGDLLVYVAGAQLRLGRPAIYQESQGRRRSVAGRYVVAGRRTVRFEVDEYDAGQALVIDPVVFFAAKFGGGGSGPNASAEDRGTAVAVDSTGAVYVTGRTTAPNFPTLNPIQGAVAGQTDVFVTKLDPSGRTLVYSTYLGGSGMDMATGIAVDSSGSVFLTGVTSSDNFPLVNPLQANRGGPSSSDAFVAKINPAGNALVFSTFLGGSAADEGKGIAVDRSGSAYVAGVTRSNDFPAVNAFQRSLAGSSDGFLAKLDASGSNLIFSTYFGGGAADSTNGVAVNSSGDAYVGGMTTSPDFPTLNPLDGSFAGGNCFPVGTVICPDAFIARFSAAGLLVYSTYLGGSGGDEVRGIAVDSTGNVLVTGGTGSSDFPTVNAAQPRYGGGGIIQSTFGDVFVTKLNPAGSALVYSTYLGGQFENEGRAIAVDAAGHAFVTGSTRLGFPIVNAFQESAGGGPFSGALSPDAFVSQLDAEGRLVFSTLWGGQGFDEGLGIAAGAPGMMYVTGYTPSGDFPTVGAFPSPQDLSQAFILNFGPLGTLNPIPVIRSYSGSSFVAGAPPFDFTLGGWNFVPTSVIRWNGAVRATTFVSDRQLSTTIPSSDLATAGTAQVTVFNPVPGGGASNAVSLTIRAGPKVNPDGVVNGASFEPGAPVAPGSLAAVFGENLTYFTSVFGLGFAAPSEVRINGSSAPVVFRHLSQINFQVPWELSGQIQGTITVTVDGTASPPQTIRLALYSPGLFRLTSGQTLSTRGAILIAGTGTLAQPEGTFVGARPASKGEMISIFCTGLGPVTNRPATGAPALSDPLSVTIEAPQVTVGGVAARVLFSGLAPGFFGLYQVNAEVPENAPAGDTVPLALSIGGVASNTVTLAVR